MSPTIRVDEDVFKWLQKQAHPFVDTPNDVLRRIAKLAPERRLRAGVTSRRPSSETGITPQREYQRLLLQILSRNGGKARYRDLMVEIEKQMRSRLTSADYGRNKSGDFIWRNRAAWALQFLKRDGLMQHNAGRGIWELTAAGWAEARKIGSP